MIIKTTNTFIGNKTRLHSVTIESNYITEFDEKDIKLTTKLRNEFEEEFKALMNKYNLVFELPF